MKYVIVIICLFYSCFSLQSQQATVRESEQEMRTYPFSDPDPVPRPNNLYYPYFRYDGFSAEAIQKKWKTVELENEYIRVTLFPEIGGKIWGATDKTSQKEFIYTNSVVKFRDIAMRGPWVSGGVEFNFGIIGHAPTSATPVDYIIKEKEDGSVSCYISAMEYVTHTTWMVEVNLPKDKAYFTTHTIWYNGSSLDQPYYQWMNAAYQSKGNLQFCYPGTHYIKHSGELYPFPIDQENRDISWYKNNGFESDKSWHVLGFYNDFYGAYWHDEDFGSIHHAAYDEKLGMKIFLWSQARDGAIWEKLLTDTDGQYVELQSGRMYSQPATESAYSPFKHSAFLPGATDEWTEYWYPVKGIKGVAKASRIGALNVFRESDSLKVSFSPVQDLNTTIRFYANDKEVLSETIRANVLHTWSKSYPLTEVLADVSLKIIIGENELVYSDNKVDNETNRPKEIPADFDWDSVYGLYIKGEQWMNQKYYDNAEINLLKALEKDKYFSPALVRLASLYYREAKYDNALELVRRALSLNTYDGEANYLYGLINYSLENYTDAKDGFAVASYSPVYRSEACFKLAACHMREARWKEAEEYANKSLQYNQKNPDALRMLLVCYRKTGKREALETLQNSLSSVYPLDHIIRFERYLSQQHATDARDLFTSLIRNELPQETYMELSLWYESIGCPDEAIELLSFIPDYPIACYKKAWLLNRKGEVAQAKMLVYEADRLSPELVFPFRPESLQALVWASSVSLSWKPLYYQAILKHTFREKKEALRLLSECKEVDFMPFFLYRASMKRGDDCLNDLLQAEAFGNSWRVGLALIKFYADRRDWKKAEEIASRCYKQYPENYVVGLQYAKVLCETAQYKRCISLLKRIEVLPNEGAYAGRGVYRDACLNMAIGYMNGHNNKKALQYIEESKIWLENLGVGKPYEDMIDYRLEKFLEAQISSSDKARLLLQQIAGLQKDRTHFESADLLSVIALRLLGKEKDADEWVSLWKKGKSNPAKEWCMAVYEKNEIQSDILLAKRIDQQAKTPWESISVDRNFELIVKLKSLLLK